MSYQTEKPASKPAATFCVLGAGNGGLAMAGYLSLAGFDVRLWNRSPRRLQPIRQRGGVEVMGHRYGFASIPIVTTNMAEAVAGADVVLVVVPASGHRTVAELCAPVLEAGQTIVLNPGRTLGAVDFEATLRRRGTRVPVTIAEAQTFLFASRVCGPAQVRIFGVKQSVSLATLDPGRIHECLATVKPALPQFDPETNVLKTSLDNIGAIFHPALVLLNSGWIEGPDRLELYTEGASSTVCRLMEQLDAERLAIADGLGVEAMSAHKWLSYAYGAEGPTLQAAMRSNPIYRGIQAPSQTRMRYITEDVPFSLVPMSSLGRHLGIPTPAMDAVITLASTVHDRDYRAEGRTLETMGIRASDLRRLLPSSDRRRPEHSNAGRPSVAPSGADGLGSHYRGAVRRGPIPPPRGYPRQSAASAARV